jgi:anti-sigma B factor antagonist
MESPLLNAISLFKAACVEENKPSTSPSQWNHPEERFLSSSEAQVWKSHNFSIACHAGVEPGIVIFRLDGPLTARDMYSSLSPNDFRRMFETLPANKDHSEQIFDISGVPYMDSTGLGVLVGLFVSSRNKGVRMSITGCTPRVVELLKMTKMDAVLPVGEWV